MFHYKPSIFGVYTRLYYIRKYLLLKGFFFHCHLELFIFNKWKNNDVKRCKQCPGGLFRPVLAPLEISSPLQAWKPTGNYNICINYNYKKNIPKHRPFEKQTTPFFNWRNAEKNTPAVPSGSDCAEEHETWDGRCSLLWFHGLDHLRRPRQVTAGHPVGSVSLWCSLGESIPTDIKNGFVRNTTKCLPI